MSEGSGLDDSVSGQGSSDEEPESDNASDASGAGEDDQAAEVPKVKVSHELGAQEDPRKRKRRQRDEYDNLESKYLDRLVDEEQPTGKRLKADEPATADATDAASDNDADSGSDDVVPVHESLAADPAVTDLEKANRTVFLSNVSAEAVTSRPAKKILMAHLSSILDKKASPPQKIESIRFRSTAFSTAAIPKRAAYIKKSVLEATTKSTNAYVVYSSSAAARLAVAELNGTTVLDRHLRVDSVAHPAAVDHRRCVFVGNLGFVDDESILDTEINEDGKEVTEKKRRTRIPMDVEEGLWRVFSKEAGKVESVRVVRDPITRVGKGFAYVQFYVSSLPHIASPSLRGTDRKQDVNAVESAVLLNEKKFPPMLPRTLRISRCKAPHRTARAMEAKHGKNPLANVKGKGKPDQQNTSYVPKVTADDKTLAGRAGKLLGRSAASQLGGKKKKWDKTHAVRRRDSAPGARAPETDGKKVMKSPEDIVFEGRRASSKDGRPKDLKFKGGGKHKKKGGPKSGGKGAMRAAKWKSGGGGDK